MSRVVAVALWVCGCQPAAPGEARARAAFVERQPALGRIEDAVLGLMAMGATGDAAHVALGDVAELGGALGLRVTGLGYAPPCSGLGRNDNVPVDSGFSEGRYRVGWGLYQTSWEAEGVKHGDGAYHPGIVVTWKLGVTDNEASACFLLDGTPRPR